LEEGDVNELIQQVYDTEHYMAEQKGLYFKIELDNDLPKIKFDKDKIIQVMVNLINNSLKFTERGGVTIKTQNGENIIKVSVKDTGSGIPEGDINKLFHAFEDIELPKGQKPKGTGLGLAICKEIVEGHSGKIWAESKAGEGTTFYFVLPIKERRSR